MALAPKSPLEIFANYYKNKLPTKYDKKWLVTIMTQFQAIFSQKKMTRSLHCPSYLSPIPRYLNGFCRLEWLSIEIIQYCVFLSLLIFLSIAGNILVCVAIYTDRGLRKIGNLFLASLAIADLFVAALVMTFAVVNDLLGYWIFGPQFCDTWVAFDVMCSTASILNLCAISLDRYIHIKDPLRKYTEIYKVYRKYTEIYKIQPLGDEAGSYSNDSGRLAPCRPHILRPHQPRPAPTPAAPGVHIGRYGVPDVCLRSDADVRRRLVVRQLLRALHSYARHLRPPLLLRSETREKHQSGDAAAHFAALAAHASRQLVALSRIGSQSGHHGRRYHGSIGRTTGSARRASVGKLYGPLIERRAATRVISPTSSDCVEFNEAAPNLNIAYRHYAEQFPFVKLPELYGRLIFSRDESFH
ncbi:unnamed protein product [Nesidiocoris tenuis]|uniref:G-protein coupled receptors family 1 profile domain-containing protein n=1 Tax=Nesidiocoris tenuis TaxID=355587 RepID=A0A6H5GE28_9HEMI|nr:unnamed protein product [Nesidiocoris tenuis]